jgi:hypothetical protein
MPMVEAAIFTTSATFLETFRLIQRSLYLGITSVGGVFRGLDGSHIHARM